MPVSRISPFVTAGDAATAAVETIRERMMLAALKSARKLLAEIQPPPGVPDPEAVAVYRQVNDAIEHAENAR